MILNILILVLFTALLIYYPVYVRNVEKRCARLERDNMDIFNDALKTIAFILDNPQNGEQIRIAFMNSVNKIYRRKND